MANTAKILVVEDKDNEREALARLLRMEKYEVLSAEGPKQALRHLDEGVDLVISDLRMGGTDGIELLRFWKSRQPATAFIMATAYGDVNSAVDAMKLGAEEYLTKPVNPDELLLLIRRCLESRRKDATIANLQERLDQRLGFEKIVGHSKAMLDIFDPARRAAATAPSRGGQSGRSSDILDPEQPILLVLNHDTDRQGVLALLWRTGFVNNAGYLVDGMTAWENAGYEMRDRPAVPELIIW